MKILIYETREDELEAIRKLGKELPIEIQTTAEIPSLENVSMQKAATAFPFWDKAGSTHCFWRLWQNLTFIIFLPRTIGYNHIDIEQAEKLGIHVCNASYAPMVSRTSPL